MHIKSVFIIVVFLGVSSVAFAMELWSDPNGMVQRMDLNMTIKWTSLGAHAPKDPILFAERDTLTELWRLRYGLDVQLTEDCLGELAYEQCARWVSTANGSSGSSGMLPSETQAPYRISSWDWQIDKHGQRFWYRHEIDRALIEIHRPQGQVIVGRQAIGLGRGVGFSAVDIFAPFSPLEVDQEWRGGVDAVRMEHFLSDTSSMEVIGIFGSTWEQSALLGRIRGYVGDFDGELIGGKRAQDNIFAAVVSATVGEAEVHAELALVNTPETHPDGSALGNDHEVLQGVIGTSYTFDIRNGLTVVGEYYYNGLGVKNTSDITTRSTDLTFQQRIVRGDMQILGQEAVCLQLSHPANDAMNTALLTLWSPQDGSGLVSPSLIWDIGTSLRLIASAYLPWGEKPQNGQIQSEYGGTPTSVFFQLGMYF